MPRYYGIDMYYILLILPAVLLALYAQMKVTSTFGKYSRVQSRRGLTGAQVAQQILRENGLSNVRVEYVAGKLTDHYDSKENVIRLSSQVYNSASVAALGIAAHEVGHALQHAKEYPMIKVRNSILPVANMGVHLSWPLFFAGLFFSFDGLIFAGIIFFALATLFQIVTLPVEFNASKRAMVALEGAHILAEDELPMARKTLSAAAMTYVASLIMSLAQMARMLLIYGGRRRD